MNETYIHRAEVYSKKSVVSTSAFFDATENARCGRQCVWPAMELEEETLNEPGPGLKKETRSEAVLDEGTRNKRVEQ
jgi:hypothetical protein